MRIRTLVGMIVAPLLAVGAAVPTITAASAAANGTTLDATTTAAGSQTLTYKWTLAKTGSPDAQNIWQGDTATVHWTVTATKDKGTPGAVDIAGTVYVHNGGGAATSGLVVQPYLVDTNQTPLGLKSADVASQHPVLASGEAFTYSYDIPVTGTLPAGPYKVGSGVTILNHSGHLGVPFGPDKAYSDGFTLTQKTIGDTLAVTDGSQTKVFSDTGTWPIDQQVKGDTLGEQTVSNEATAPGGLDAKASVKVTVYGLNVDKTAQAVGFTRTYKWALGDPKAPDKVTADAPGSYTVPVTVTAEDSGYQVAGKITITNPSPDLTAKVTVTDSLGVQLAAGQDWPTSLAPGQTVTLDYTFAPANGDPGKNTVTVTLENGTAFTKDASWTFDGVKPTKEVDKTATIHNVGTIAGDDTHTQGQGTDRTLPVTDP